MTEQAILEAVQEIFRDNFDDDTLEITRATCADDIEDWDSLEQINLLTAIEKKFNIKFKLPDVLVLERFAYHNGNFRIILQGNIPDQFALVFDIIAVAMGAEIIVHAA